MSFQIKVLRNYCGNLNRQFGNHSYLGDGILFKQAVCQDVLSQVKSSFSRLATGTFIHTYCTSFVIYTALQPACIVTSYCNHHQPLAYH
jgi:hypothetical protein